MHTETIKFVTNIKRTLLVLLILLLMSVGMIYAIGYVKIAGGLFLGMMIGGLYFLLMSWRIYRASQLSKAQAIVHMRAGWWVRFSFILLALLFSVYFSAIDFWAVVAGLISLHLVIVINALVIAFQDYKS